MKDERRFCPLHGDYLPSGRSAQCPECRVDPVASGVSLRQVRVVGEQELDPDGAEEDGVTPLRERFECPVCGTSVPAADFRTEAAGEVWQGEAAVWAEEGVCSDCYRDVVLRDARSWSASEWLVHHYEGWRRMTESVHEIFVYEYSSQGSWLPESERIDIVDVESTLAARREHLARCQMAMEELQGRYEAKITPPPFQMTLASASDALSEPAIEALKLRRLADLAAEEEARILSSQEQAAVFEEALSEEDVPTEPRLLARVTQRLKTTDFVAPVEPPQEWPIFRLLVLLSMLAAAATVYFLLSKNGV